MTTFLLRRAFAFAIVSLFFLITGIHDAVAQSETCAAAPNISVGTTCSNTSITMTTFQVEASPPTMCTAATRDGWLAFTTDGVTTSVTVDATINRPWGVAVYSGVCGSLSQIACTSGAAGASGTLTATVSPNTTYLIRIARTNTGTNAMTGTICVYASTPPCTPLAIPASENFSSYATIFSASCSYTRSNTTDIFGDASSAFGVGTGSIEFNFYNFSGNNRDLATPVFTAVPANYQLTFDHAYATYETEVDNLVIRTSTNAGSSYTALTSYAGGLSGPLNTGGATLDEFYPTAEQWATKSITLPVGTNRIVFRGNSSFGNNLFIDNVRIEPIPSCIAPASLTTNTITSSSANLSWTASVSNPSSGYEWEIRTTGAGGSGATGLVAQGSTGAGVTTAASGNVLLPDTDYRLFVRANCGAGDFSTWTGPHLFFTPCVSATLPVYEGLNAANITCWTQQVVTDPDTFTPPTFYYEEESLNPFGLLPQEGTGFYAFNSYDCDPGDQIRMQSVPIVTTGTISVDVLFKWAVDNEFTENDRVQVQYSLNNTTWINAGPEISRYQDTDPMWTQQSVTLPAGAGNQPVIYVGFLFTGEFGNDCHIDDIVIQASPSCIPPTNVTAGALTTSSIAFSWTASVTTPSGGYDWEVRTSGAGGSGNTGLAASGGVGAGVLNANATGLAEGEVYNIYVRSDCGLGDLSTWIGPLTLNTPCNVATLPFYEGLNASIIPCWTTAITNDTDNDFTDLGPAFYYQTNSINPSGLTPQEGGGFLVFNSYDCDTGDQIRLISAPLNTTGIPSVDVNFKWSTDDEFSGSNDRVRLQYSLNGTTWTFAAPAIARYANNDPTWTQQIVTLPAAAGNQPLLYVGFLFTSGYGNDCHIDDIQVIATPTCAIPSALSVTNSGNAADLTWTAPGAAPAAGYQWEIRTSGSPGSGNAGLASSGSTVAGDIDAHATGLSVSTSYSAYVRSNCGPGDYSIWIGPVAFTTLSFVPVSNDLPSGAILSVYSGNAYPSCGVISGSAAQALNSPQSTGTGPDVWYRFTAQSSAVRISLTSAGMDNAIALFNSSIVLMPGGNENASNTVGTTERLNYSGLTPGQLYYVSVGAATGAGAPFTLCIQHLMPSSCADGSGVYDLCNNFKADYSGANLYSFAFTQTSPSTGPVTTATHPSQVPLSSAGLNLRHGYSYDVTVSAIYNLVDGLGQPEQITVPGSAVCNITIAPHADLRTKDTQRCPATVLKGTHLQAKPFVCAAVNHTVEFTEVAGCTGAPVIGPSFTATTSGASSTIWLASVGGVQAGKWYAVRWRPNFNYGPGTYGTADIIQLGGVATAQQQEQGFEAIVKMTTANAAINIYPNPNSGSSININMDGLVSEKLSVEIFDETGRNIFNDQYTVDGVFNNQVIFYNRLDNGIYFLRMRCGEMIETKQFIVQN